VAVCSGAAAPLGQDTVLASPFSSAGASLRSGDGGQGTPLGSGVPQLLGTAAELPELAEGFQGAGQLLADAGEAGTELGGEYGEPVG
jgi:hypothetical protein